MDVNNHLSHAYMKVEGLLSGQVALEDFVQAGMPLSCTNLIPLAQLFHTF